jgi:hypothetical protein
MTSSFKLISITYCLFFYSIYFSFGFYDKEFYPNFILSVGLFTWFSFLWDLCDGLDHKKPFNEDYEEDSLECIINPILNTTDQALRTYTRKKHRIGSVFFSFVYCIFFPIYILWLIFKKIPFIFKIFDDLSLFSPFDYFSALYEKRTCYKESVDGKYTLKYFLDGRVEHYYKDNIHHDTKAAIILNESFTDTLRGYKLKLPKFYFNGNEVKELELRKLYIKSKINNL